MTPPSILIRIATDEGQYEPALRYAPVGVWNWAPGSGVLTISPACLVLAGRDDATSDELVELMHPDDRQRLLHALEALNDGKNDRFLFRFRTMGGVGRKHFEATGIVERGSDGAVERISGWVMESAHAPGFAETVLEALPNPMFVKDERERRWIGGNEAFARLIGKTLEGTLGNRDADFFPEEEARHFERMDDEVFATGGNEVEEPITASDGRKSWILTKKTAATLPTGERILVGIITDITERKQNEVALAKAHEAALEGAQTKSRFLANMSHEIRTPLNGALGMIESIDTKSLSAEQREALEIIKSSGDTLLTVIDDILDFSKLESGRIAVEQVEFSPRDVAEDVARLLADAAGRRSLELSVDLHPDVPALLKGDPTRTRQVLFNLVGNALKFTNQGCVMIEVRAVPEESAVDFRVIDTGIGLDTSALAELFVAFARADESTTRQVGGTGLGLSISKQLAQLLGGDLLVQSDLGVGSIFTFRLPCTEFEAPSPREPIVGCVALVDLPGCIALPIARRLSATGTRVLAVDKPSEVPKTCDVVFVDGRKGALKAIDTLSRRSTPVPLVVLERYGEENSAAGVSLKRTVVTTELRRAVQSAIGATEAPEHHTDDLQLRKLPLTVLVAEDNRVNQLVALRMLSRIGVDVDIAENGRVAVQAASRKRYDAILMDCHMPVVDGYEATITIRQLDDHYRSAPIIALTASALGPERERCAAAGMSDHIAKPVRIEDLHRVLASWCHV